MLFRQRVKTVARIVELVNFVQNRIAMHGLSCSPESLKRKFRVGVAQQKRHLESPFGVLSASTASAGRVMEPLSSASDGIEVSCVENPLRTR
jgi:hypothetical protein